MKISSFKTWIYLIVQKEIRDLFMQIKGHNAKNGFIANREITHEPKFILE